MLFPKEVVICIYSKKLFTFINQKNLYNMKKFFYLVALAIVAMACNTTIKAPIDDTGLFVICEKGTPI